MQTLVGHDDVVISAAVSPSPLPPRVPRVVTSPPLPSRDGTISLAELTASVFVDSTGFPTLGVGGFAAEEEALWFTNIAII